MKKHLSPSIWCLLFLAASWASCDNNDAKLQDEPETKTVTCPGDGACLPTGGADLWFSEPDDGCILSDIGSDKAGLVYRVGADDGLLRLG